MLYRHLDTSFSDVMLQDQGSVAIRWWKVCAPVNRKLERRSTCNSLLLSRALPLPRRKVYGPGGSSVPVTLQKGDHLRSQGAVRPELPRPQCEPRLRCFCIADTEKPPASPPPWEAASSHCFCLSKFGLPAMLPAMTYAPVGYITLIVWGSKTSPRTILRLNHPMHLTHHSCSPFFLHILLFDNSSYSL